MAAMDEKLSSGNRGNPIRCRAAVSRKPGEPLVIEEIIVAPPMPHEVRVRIVYTSMCHSDITFWKMKDFPAVFPRILGHEAIGVVESVGEEVTEVAEGDTVIPTLISECGECVDCRSTKSNLCSKLPFKQISPFMPRHETSRFTDLNDSGLLGCGVSTGVGAAWRTANVEPGSTVAIFGLGSIGLAVAEGARLCGATKIIGVDVNQDKFEIGKKFGVTDFINPANCENKSVTELMIEMTKGGADYCFECVGNSSLVQQAYACCRKGKTLMGSFFGGLKPKSDIPVLLNRYINKELQLDEFVTHEVTFEDINKAFDLLIEGKCLRCIICMNTVSQLTD
ncbi:hypothetical protein ACLB2K_017937 [Fragaria x ananassa]